VLGALEFIVTSMINQEKENKGGEAPVSPTAPVSEREQSLLAKVGWFFLDLIKLAIIAGLTVGLVRYFLFKPFYVKGQSMEPTYHENEYLIIDEISYRLREPKRGDVIVFHAPVGEDYYLKRIIGMPNERVKLENNKIIIYNEQYPQGIVMEEKYLTEETGGQVSFDLKADEYFVLGDNRDSSYDSRRFGPIKQSAIVGRTWFRGWPIHRIGIVGGPEYNF